MRIRGVTVSYTDLRKARTIYFKRGGFRMRHTQGIKRWATGVWIALVLLAPAIDGSAFAAETSKIHIQETKYGDFLEGKTCEPDLSRCEGKPRCEVPPKDYKCKTTAKPDEIQLKIIWDCGGDAHAAGHGAGPGTGKQTYILTCPYIPRLNP